MSEKQISDIRADPAFKLVTNRAAEEIGLKLISAEFPQTLTADLVLEVPEDIGDRLDNTLFSFLKGYRYAIIDFKGENDQLTTYKFINNLARTALFYLKREDVPVNQILNLYVSSSRPEALLGAANRSNLFSQTDEQPWLWKSALFFQEIAIVVCRDLPIEPRYYDWLAFAPSDTNKWKSFVRLVINENRRDLFELLARLSPKGLKAMEIDVNEIISQYDKKKQKRLNRDFLELLGWDVAYLVEDDPEATEKVVNNLVKGLGRKKFLDTLNEEEKAELLKLLQANQPPKPGDN